MSTARSTVAFNPLDNHSREEHSNQVHMHIYTQKHRHTPRGPLDAGIVLGVEELLGVAAARHPRSVRPSCGRRRPLGDRSNNVRRLAAGGRGDGGTRATSIEEARVSLSARPRYSCCLLPAAVTAAHPGDSITAALLVIPAHSTAHAQTGRQTGLDKSVAQHCGGSEKERARD